MRAITHVPDDVTITYDAKMTICSNGSLLEVKSYPHTRKRVKQGYEPDKKPVKPPRLRKDASDDRHIETKNLNRTRNTLIAYASENEMLWLSFLTLTFKENVKDVQYANKRFHNWVRQIQRIKPDFAYLAVPEFQKRGAVHYHLLTNLQCGTDVPERDPIITFNPMKKQRYEIVYYDIPYWKEGFSSAQDLVMVDDSFNCALYLIKYLFKDMDGRLWGHKKILKSNNLKSPETYYLSTLTFHGALAYLQEKGYQINAHDFQPYQRYQEPHTCFTLRERLNSYDHEMVESIVSESYSERHDRSQAMPRAEGAPGLAEPDRRAGSPELEEVREKIKKMRSVSRSRNSG